MMTRFAASAALVELMRSKAAGAPMSKPREAEPEAPAPRSRTPAPSATAWPTVLLKLRIAPALTLTDDVPSGAD